MRGTESFHDSKNGKQKGKNTIYIIEWDGMRLAHLGDYGATVFSGFSYNHQAGELWVKKHELSGNAEGIPTLKAVKLLMDRHRVAMPICSLLYQIFYENLEPAEIVKELMKRQQESDLA